MVSKPLAQHVADYADDFGHPIGFPDEASAVWDGVGQVGAIVAGVSRATPRQLFTQAQQPRRWTLARTFLR